jgi:hypothetical protein
LAASRRPYEYEVLPAQRPHTGHPSSGNGSGGYVSADASFGCATVIQSDLRFKHEQMKESPFGFLRGTFYRWAQLWPSVCADLCHTPKVLAVGDLHVNGFGTWRDVEGRLCWGVDDFDEAYPLAYTNDLVRLAASVKIVIDAEGLPTSKNWLPSSHPPVSHQSPRGFSAVRLPGEPA